MANVLLYTKSYCPFSKECKEFLEGKNVEYDERMIDEDVEMKMEMGKKAGGRTDTPQVFVNGQHIGSFDDLKALDATGKLDSMLDL